MSEPKSFNIDAIKRLLDESAIDVFAIAKQRANEAWQHNHWETHAFLDVDEHHPALWGDAILLRDDDGMGFALNLGQWRGEHVRITIERVPSATPRLWGHDEKKP